MADDDFYTRDRPDHPELPEDRPRGGGPEDAPARSGSRRGKPVWAVIALVALVIILLALFMP
ncbi:hypothetical protein [Streptomyces griseomycini]|uniref:Uncharacterized protein n=1 Tax=Streptomyces griseomycini TaxID=66895 RepID=A0A7W7PVV1_9ACTN|nr:hypothetical protein [Streptomyces griseomycini]MBB4902156.1 hypothetical protein [Streptomyces griseomycini]GGQ18822.1 hypothetical protein GCM10010266_47470 [Streptomyces griseomycini]GGR37495.1 hypothetical protein GCM10015536_49160 [Streptomyces griseomycini]